MNNNKPILKAAPPATAGMQNLVDALVAKAQKASQPPSAPVAITNKSTKSAKLQRIQKSLNLPDFQTYLEAFTDLPEDLIDELMLIVEKSPSALAIQTFAKKWNIA